MSGHKNNAVALSISIAFAVLTSCVPAFALNPALDVSRYAHTAWTVADGFTRGAVYSIAQTPDGYLWLGTEFGLLRFDGVRTTPWPSSGALPSQKVHLLLTGRDGTLWIGTSRGLVSWKDGKLTTHAELAGRIINVGIEDRDGTVWVTGVTPPTGKLCAIRNGGARCWGEDGLFGSRVFTMYEDRNRNLWFGELHGVWQWNRGHPQFYPLPSDKFVQALGEDDDGALLVLLSGRIYRMVDGNVREAYRLPGTIAQLTTRGHMLRDRHGGLWIGTLGGGLAHLHEKAIDRFSQTDGLSSDSVQRIFQDREGNIWVATHAGLDRFRELPVTPLTLRQGFSSLYVRSLLAATDGSVWLRTVDGVNHWKSGKVTVYREFPDLSNGTTLQTLPPANDDAAGSNPELSGGSLFQDERGRVWVSSVQSVGYFDRGRFHVVRGVPGGRVLAITGDLKGNLWLAHETHGLFHLAGERVVGQISWAHLGHADYAAALAVDPSTGGLWLGFYGGGLEFMNDGQVRTSYTAAQGLGQGRINDLRFGRDGSLWAAAESGVSRLKNGHFTLLSFRDGLPCTDSHWTIEDDDGDFWLSTPCALIRIARTELDAWASLADMKRPFQSTIRPTLFGSSDGVRSRATAGGFSPHVAKAQDGRLWFFPLDGLSVIDPRRVSLNKLPPSVEIEQINADRQIYSPAPEVRLPPLIRDLEIDYTALSFVAPDQVMFRTKLEGRDQEWQDVGNRRQAFYTNLSPGTYRFRVTASNNRGVWNDAGAVLNFTIAPAFYQTIWFRVVAVALVAALLWGLHQLRLRQIAYQFDSRLQERLSERTRIARELHDTLLQSFHGIMFRLQAVRNMLPGRTDEAIHTLDTAILTTERAIAEGRDAIQDLRSAPSGQRDLGQALATFAREVGSPETNRDSPTFRVTIEGEPRLLSPTPHDEVCRIARELIRNAFRHARAQRIEAEIRYEEHLFCLRIRDDGTGIDPRLLHEAERAGHLGHWGLRGIRERAHRIGAQLDFWSDTGAGTEVQLQLPAAVAYERSDAESRLSLP